MSTTFNFGAKQWATKEGSILAYNDENNNFKPLPFDFTRSSSATRVNKDGLIEVVGSNEPRVDYLNNADGHLLLEPQRKNDVPYSEDISGYQNFGSTDSSNVAISPDGSQNASSFQGDGSYDQALLSSDLMVLSSSGSYTFSVFAKKGVNKYIQLFANEFTGATNVEGYFDLENGTTPTSGAKIEDYGNGWWRCSIVVTIDAGDLSGRISIRTTPSTSDFRWTPFSANIGQTIYVYGFQVEQGSYATSYIPTSGSSVTRAAEDAMSLVLPSSEILDNSSSTVYLNFQALANDITNRWISFEETTTATDNEFEIRLSAGSNLMQIVSRSAAGGQDVVLSNTLSDITANNKVAIKYDGLNWAFFVNGVNVDTEVASRLFNDTLQKIRFARYNNTNSFYGRVFNLKIYNTALTDSELIALTS